MQHVVTRTGRIAFLWLVVVGASLEAQPFVTLIEQNHDPLEASRAALVNAREALLDARRTLDDALFRVDETLLALEQAQAHEAASLAARSPEPASGSDPARDPAATPPAEPVRATTDSLADAECEDEEAAQGGSGDAADGLAAWSRFVREGGEAARGSAAFASSTLGDAVEFCRPHVERFLKRTAGFLAAREDAGPGSKGQPEPGAANEAAERVAAAGESSNVIAPREAPPSTAAGTDRTPPGVRETGDVEAATSTAAASTLEPAAPAATTATTEETTTTDDQPVPVATSAEERTDASGDAEPPAGAPVPAISTPGDAPADRAAGSKDDDAPESGGGTR